MNAIEIFRRAPRGPAFDLYRALMIAVLTASDDNKSSSKTCGRVRATGRLASTPTSQQLKTMAGTTQTPAKMDQ
jgi:hypothetical protein